MGAQGYRIAGAERASIPLQGPPAESGLRDWAQEVVTKLQIHWPTPESWGTVPRINPVGRVQEPVYGAPWGRQIPREVVLCTD